MAETYTKDTFWAELEQAGEELVRVRVATRAYAHDPKRALAILWLEKKDQERADALSRELAAAALAQVDEASAANRLAHDANDIARSSMVFARSANTIASDANALAVRANRHARMAAIAALVAAIASIAAFIVPLLRAS